jgi:hypothetical protein
LTKSKSSEHGIQYVVTGVPPHIKELMDLEALRKEQSELTDKYEKVMNGLRQSFEVRGIGGGKMTEARIREIISEGCRQTAEDLVHKIEDKLDYRMRVLIPWIEAWEI